MSFGSFGSHVRSSFAQDDDDDDDDDDDLVLRGKGQSLDSGGASTRSASSDLRRSVSPRPEGYAQDGRPLLETMSYDARLREREIAGKSPSQSCVGSIKPLWINPEFLFERLLVIAAHAAIGNVSPGILGWRKLITNTVMKQVRSQMMRS